MVGVSKMQSEEVFRRDSYLKECHAEVVSVNELGGIILDVRSSIQRAAVNLAIPASYAYQTEVKLSSQRQ